MADAFAANYHPWALYSNPSGISKQKNMWIGISYQNRFLLKQLSTKSLAFILPIDRNVFAFSFSSFGYTKYFENTISFYYAINILEKLSTAINFNLFTFNKLTKISFDISCIIQFKDYLNFGLSIVNPISEYITNSSNKLLDSYIKAAFNYKIIENTNIVLEIQPYLFINKFIYKLGLQYAAFKHFLINFGISSHFNLFSIGFGIIL